MLALPHFKQDTVQQEPPEVVALFEDFAGTTSEQKIQRWKKIKQEQKDYLASWKLVYKSERTKANKAGSSMDHKRVPTPPPPPSRPMQNVGTSAKSAPPAPSWIEHLSDDRRI